jgi:hypothetical protein
MRSRAASSSNENRGHCDENEQHAPQARQMDDGSSCISVALMGVIPSLVFVRVNSRPRNNAS